MDDCIYTKYDNTLVTKVCITCHKKLSINLYGKRRYRSSKPDAHWIYSRYGECLKCASKRKALWRLNNSNYMKEWYIKHKQISSLNNE